MRDHIQRTSSAGADPEEVSSRKRLIITRTAVVKGWQALSERLMEDGYRSLVARIGRFIGEMPPVRTEIEAIAELSRAEQGSVHPRETVRSR